jgi:hypothetical protein
MFQFARAFLLCGLLASTLTAADQNSLSDVEALQREIIADDGAEMDDEALQGELVEDVDTEIEQRSDKCADGFTYQRSVGRCYQIVHESHDWWSAARRCQELHSRSHLVAITSEAENNALMSYLARENPGHRACSPPEHKRKGGLLWTSGQRRDENKCGRNNPFVWKVPGQPLREFHFAHWRKNEPNCFLGRERCVLIWYNEGFGWNDDRCSLKMCPLCQYTPL